ncbi:MAG: hypothetical protein UW17_C0005G0012 [Candidatus Nomurabacteria bacterium GW2011_GWD1_44_10]|nr:MAG: hypothetical protein UW17_C0005G0012 [Candidatus Nomurabacteria bacterium GW2011_GWD1_44_10]HBB43868.1 hypothetical protein [Candidatus Yonathbacteria bacterium]
MNIKNSFKLRSQAEIDEENKKNRKKKQDSIGYLLSEIGWFVKSMRLRKFQDGFISGQFLVLPLQ